MYVSIDAVGDRTPASRTPSGRPNRYAMGPAMYSVIRFPKIIRRVPINTPTQKQKLVPVGRDGDGGKWDATNVTRLHYSLDNIHFL